MSTIVYLTRHGQTIWNLEKRLQGRGDSPLTENGKERAEELKERIKDLNIDIIYSSPIRRALTTAEIIRGDKNIEIVTEDDLMEMCFGDYEGEKTEDITKENPEWNIQLIMQGNTDMTAPNGENLSQVRERVAKAMDNIININRNKSILIVAHGITLKAIMYYFKDKEVNNEVMGQATLTKIIVSDSNDYKIEFKDDDSHFTVKEQKMGW